MVGIDALMPGGERLRAPTVAAILVGGLGAVLLIVPRGLGEAGGAHLWGAFLLLQLANFAWSFGSLRQRRMRGTIHPIVSGAVQQLAAGLACLPLTFIERGSPIQWTFRSTAAVVYLIVFGSIVGYSAYVYALDKLPVALVSIYTYVNPIVAVILGWLFFRESFGWTDAAGMGVIFLGVAMVKRFSSAPTAVEVD
jgi:drug/metabolite transporter (DMT)-like permease